MSKYVSDPKYIGTFERSFALLLDNSMIALSARDRRQLVTDEELIRKLVEITQRPDLKKASDL